MKRSRAESPTDTGRRELLTRGALLGGALVPAIVGRGTIDGNAMAFHDPTRQHDSGDFDRSFTRQGAGFMPKGVLFEHGPFAHGERPGDLVRFFECRDVLVHGVTIQNSPAWTSHYRKCENVT